MEHVAKVTVDELLENGDRIYEVTCCGKTARRVTVHIPSTFTTKEQVKEELIKQKLALAERVKTICKTLEMHAEVPSSVGEEI